MGNTPIQTKGIMPYSERRKVQVSIIHAHANPPPRGWKPNETLHFYTYGDITVGEWLHQFNENRRPQYQLYYLKQKNGNLLSMSTTMDKGPFYV